MLWSPANGKLSRPRTCEMVVFLTRETANSILCGDLAIKAIEEPFTTDADDGGEWAI